MRDQVVSGLISIRGNDSKRLEALTLVSHGHFEAILDTSA